MSYTEFYTPTKVYFGKETEKMAGNILREYNARKVLIHYGSGSAEKTGLLSTVRKSLSDNGIEFVELGGVCPNPRLSLARKGIDLCRREKVDFILAIGGGSVLDSAKCIAYGVPYEGDVWDLYTGTPVSARIPFGTILTLSATGSEMSNSSVITNDEKTPNDKIGCNTVFGRAVFSILNPQLTYSVSKYQTASGSTDIIMHTLERFFHKGPVLELTDNIAATLIKTVIENTLIALETPDDYQARANLMWAGSLSHNDLTQFGYDTRGDWSCHRLEHELSAVFDVAHGAGLSSIWSSWARYVVSEDPERFAKLGKLVFEIEDSDVLAAANKTIDAMEKTFVSFGMPVNLHDLGIKADDSVASMLAAKASLNGKKILGNFKILQRDDMYAIYKSAE